MKHERPPDVLDAMFDAGMFKLPRREGNDVDQFRGGRTETVLEPLSIRSGMLIEPYADIIHRGIMRKPHGSPV